MSSLEDKTVVGLLVLIIWALVWLRIPYAIGAIKRLLDSDREHITRGGAKYGND